MPIAPRNVAPDAEAYADEHLNRAAGYTPTWSLAAAWLDHMTYDAGCQPMPLDTRYYVDPNSTTVLGLRGLSDAQADMDGDLVRLACYGRGR